MELKRFIQIVFMPSCRPENGERGRGHAAAPRMSKKLAFGDLFRQMLKKCLRPGAQTPRPPGTGGKRQPGGLLPPKVAQRPTGGERNERWARPAPAATIERPGKAGRYESTLEGLRALQTSRKEFVSSLTRKALRFAGFSMQPGARAYFCRMLWLRAQTPRRPEPGDTHAL